MIIGSGDIASVLTDRDDVTYFVSGVSNSRETRTSEFEREMILLRQQPRDRHLIYISTLAIYYSETDYTRHKLRMEDFIREYFHSYTIFRIGNITWGKNPHTLINYLREHPEAEVIDTYRYLVSKDEFLHWVNLAPIGQKTEMNITGKLTWVPDLKRKLHG